MKTCLAALCAAAAMTGTACADVIYEWVPISPATRFGDPADTVPFYASITLTDEAVAAGGSDFRLGPARGNLPQPPFDPLATDPLTLSYVTGGRIADFRFAYGGTSLDDAFFDLSGDTVLGWVQPYFDTNGRNPGFPNGIFEFDLTVEGDELFGTFDVVGLFVDFMGTSDEFWAFDFNSNGGACFLSGACQDATGRFVRQDALAVPEPGTLAILIPALGLLGFAASRRR